MAEVSKTAKTVPTQHGPKKVDQEKLAAAKVAVGPDPCPAEDICKSLNNFYQGYCSRSASGGNSQRCQVSMILLLNKLLGKKK